MLNINIFNLMAHKIKPHRDCHCEMKHKLISNMSMIQRGSGPRGQKNIILESDLSLAKQDTAFCANSNTDQGSGETGTKTKQKNT